MPLEITLKIRVEQPDRVMGMFDRIQVHRATSHNGTYTELTTTSTRPILEYGKTEYQFVDTAGETSYWYKYRYSDDASGRVSPFSNRTSGLGLINDHVITVDELKELYLFGVNIVDDRGRELSDRAYQLYINSAIARLERQTHVDIYPRRRVERYDHWPNDWAEWGLITLDHAPVTSVTSLGVRFFGNTLYEPFPATWNVVGYRTLRLKPQGGELANVPFTGTGGFWSILQSGQEPYPELFEVKYDSGFAAGQVPDDIKHAVAMMAAIGPLNIAGDLIVGAGIASTCIAGDTRIWVEEEGWVAVRDLVGRPDFMVLAKVDKIAGLVPMPAHSARVTGETGHSMPMVKVTLSNGNAIRCTADHRFMRQSGEWMEAGKLFEGAQLQASEGENVTVLKVDDIRGGIEVYDITVPVAQCFMAEGVVIHNSIGVPGLNMSTNTTSSATNCLHGDSLVLTMEFGWEPISGLVDQERFHVVAWDGERFVVAPACNARITGTAGHDKPMVRVTQGDGVYLDCTADHLFMLADGSWCPAGDLMAAPEPAMRVPGGSFVVSVEPIEGAPDVYDLEVPGLHNFVCDFFVVHNSGYGARILEYKKTLKEMIPEITGYYRGIYLEGLGS